MKGDLSELYAELGKEVLPEEYGGDNGTLAEIEGMSLFFQLQAIQNSYMTYFGPT